MVCQWTYAVQPVLFKGQLYSVLEKSSGKYKNGFRVCACDCVCMYVYTCVCVHVGMCIHVRVYVYKYIRVCACIQVLTGTLSSLLTKPKPESHSGSPVCLVPHIPLFSKPGQFILQARPQIQPPVSIPLLTA